MINVDELTVEMLKVLFPDVASPGFSEWAVFWGFLGVAGFALMLISACKNWPVAHMALYTLLCVVGLFACFLMRCDHVHVWRNETLPGALSRDPEAAIVVHRVKNDIEWINKRAEQRRKRQQEK